MDISDIEIDITIVQGKDLVAKDTHLLGKKTTSDPLIKAYITMGAFRFRNQEYRLGYFLCSN